MSGKTKISIIVPAYNAERWIGRCIESVLGQTYENHELIIVDDGSTDGTLDVCLRYKSADSRIVVISQENAGVNAARNKGIDSSSGGYLMFLDADDWIGDDVLMECSKVIKDRGSSDILQFPIISVMGDNEYIGEFMPETKTYADKKDVLADMVEKKNISTYLWSKLFSAHLFRNFRFNDDIKFGEDTYALVDLICLSSSVATTSSGFYYYYQHDESVTHRENVPYKYRDLAIMNLKIYKALVNWNAEKQVIADYYPGVLDICMAASLNSKDKAETDELLDELDKMKLPLKGNKDTRWSKLSFIIGCKFTERIYNSIVRLRLSVSR